MDPEAFPTLRVVSDPLGSGSEGDLQQMVLEQLCMILLISNNVDKCFDSCPPQAFIPALCKIFMDPEARDNVLDVTARALTYYLDVSVDCTQRITAVDGGGEGNSTSLTPASVSWE